MSSWASGRPSATRHESSIGYVDGVVARLRSHKDLLQLAAFL